MPRSIAAAGGQSPVARRNRRTIDTTEATRAPPISASPTGRSNAAPSVTPTSLLIRNVVGEMVNNAIVYAARPAIEAAAA